MAAFAGLDHRQFTKTDSGEKGFTESNLNQKLGS